MVPAWHEWSRYRSKRALDREHRDLKLRLHRSLRQEQILFRGVPHIRITSDEDVKLVVVTIEPPQSWWPTRFEGWDIEYAKALPARFKIEAH